MRIKIGSIIEIPTSKGLAYAQYTHKHGNYGALLRVLEGFYTETPKDLELLVSKNHVFLTFFPLGAAIRRKIFKVIGHSPIPQCAQNLPLFKSCYRDHITNEVTQWFLWDGEKYWNIDRLSPTEESYPWLEIVNDTALIHYIEQGYMR